MKVVAPHLEQVPTLLKGLMDKSIPEDDATVTHKTESMFSAFGLFIE